MEPQQAFVASLAVALLRILLLPLVGAGPVASSKRGLVFTPSSAHPQDNNIWTTQPSDLTWYYNYQASPSPIYFNLSQADFEFVPMLWGAPSDTSDTTFLDTVTSLVKDQGVNISHVLTFNEPDGPLQNGGSNIDPARAAQVWINNIIPLQQNMSIRVGLPACTGGYGGIPWLQQFLGNCSKIIGEPCKYSFVPIHWYGSFEGLASHIGSYIAAFPNSSIWVTEYNYDNQDLATSQSFYNTSAEYFDRLDYLERYSLFGAFRSDASNIGPNAAMLSSGGELTNIGEWYLGRDQAGVDPTTGAGGRPLPKFIPAVASILITVVLVFF